jgi:hypothetical protein
VYNFTYYLLYIYIYNFYIIISISSIWKACHNTDIFQKSFYEHADFVSVMSGNQALEFSQNLPIVFAHDTFVLIDWLLLNYNPCTEIAGVQNLQKLLSRLLETHEDTMRGFQQHCKAALKHNEEHSNHISTGPCTNFPPLWLCLVSVGQKGYLHLSKGTSSRCSGGVPILGWNILESY